MSLPSTVTAVTTMAPLPLFKDTVPLDIVYEVLSHLEPGDILALARTSKSLRKMLMTRRSAHLWRKARENTGANIPAPPDYISEPALANLIACNHCHKCLNEMCAWQDNIFWEISARFCGLCTDFRLDFVQDIPLFAAMEWDIGDESYPPGPEHLRLRLGDTRLLSQFLPTDVSDKSSELIHKPYMLYDDVAAFLSRMKSIGDHEVALAYLEEQATRQLNHRKYMKEFKGSYKVWQAIKTNRSETRRQSIIKRLKDEGWEAEFQDHRRGPIRSWSHHAVKKPHPLYEHEWQMIRPEILEVMEKAKKERLEQERADSIQNRITALASVLKNAECRAHNWPLTADVALGVPRVRELLLMPTEATVTAAAFDFLPELLQTWVPQWRAQAAGELAQLVRASVGEIADGADPLDLAVGALFCCNTCHKTETFPQVLTHSNRCERRRPYLINCEAAKDAGITGFYFYSASKFSRGPRFPLGLWHATEFAVADTAVLRRVVELYGMDPRHATIRDMDASPVRVAVSVGGAVKVMDWISAYKHCVTAVAHDAGDTARSDAVSAELAKLFVLPEQLCRQARPLEERYTASLFSNRSIEPIEIPEYWACAHCAYNIETLPESGMRSHVVECHDEEHPMRMRDYVPTLPSRLTRPMLAPITYLISREHEGDVDKLPFGRDLAGALDAGTAAFCDIVDVLKSSTLHTISV